jgi:hypothetical protein
VGGKLVIEAHAKKPRAIGSAGSAVPAAVGEVKGTGGNSNDGADSDEEDEERGGGGAKQAQTRTMEKLGSRFIPFTSKRWTNHPPFTVPLTLSSHRVTRHCTALHCNECLTHFVAISSCSCFVLKRI